MMSGPKISVTSGGKALKEFMAAASTLQAIAVYNTKVKNGQFVARLDAFILKIVCAT